MGTSIITVFFFIILISNDKVTSAISFSNDFGSLRDTIWWGKFSQGDSLHSDTSSEYVHSYSSTKESGSPGMTATLSEAGLTYAKDVLVKQVLKEITPLAIPNVSVTESTYLGDLEVTLNNIKLNNVTVPEAAIELSSEGITIFGEGATANITLHWRYSFAGLLGDGGNASVQVRGMQAGIQGLLKEDNGALILNITNNAVVIEKLDITLHGGFSWAYNWLIASFTQHLRAAVESAVNSGMLLAASKLDNYLQNLPRKVIVDSVSAIDTSLVEDPIIDERSLSFAPRGEFVSVKDPLVVSYAAPTIPDGALCSDAQSMVTIALSDTVVNSAAKVYYEAGSLAYEVDSLPETVPIHLNTASWRLLVPQLYRQYPNRPMKLQFAAGEQPQAQFVETGIVAQVVGDMIIVVDPAEGETGDSVSVACLSMAATMEGVASIGGNNLTGVAQLDDLTLELKWSTIGNFPVHTLQVVVRAMVKGVLIPLLNLSLGNGFPLPVIPGVQIHNASVVYGNHFLLVCTDVEYTGGLFSARSSSRADFGVAVPALKGGTVAADEAPGDGQAVAIAVKDEADHLEVTKSRRWSGWKSSGRSYSRKVRHPAS